MNLRDYLHINKMTAENMARQLDITGTYLRFIKNGDKIPGKYLAEQIEIFTGGLVTVEELRGGNVKPRTDQ